MCYKAKITGRKERGFLNLALLEWERGDIFDDNIIQKPVIAI